MNDLPENPPGYGLLILTFLRISLLGFGGPNAHLALILDEIVDRRKWITREHFMHLVGVTNLLPGPNSSEVVIHIGYTQRGWRGSLATGLAFLLPTLVMVTLFSALYFRYGTVPAVEGLFWGLKPAILAVILAAGWKLGKTALDFPNKPNAALLLLGAGGILTAFFLDRFEVPVMVLGGLIAWVLWGRSRPKDTTGGPSDSSTGSASPTRPGVLALPLLVSSASPVTLGGVVISPLASLFLLMFGSGAVLFGGGYMLVALLEPFVVEGFGWLTADQFLDGIALTQAVPGPIVTLVAFVGFAVAGVPGAVLATAGIYLPSFLAVWAVAPHLEKWRHAEGFRAALKGVNAVVAGAILGVGLTLLGSGLPDVWAAALFLAALLARVRFDIPAVWIVAAGLAAGTVNYLVVG